MPRYEFHGEGVNIPHGIKDGYFLLSLTEEANANSHESNTNHDGGNSAPNAVDRGQISRQFGAVIGGCSLGRGANSGSKDKEGRKDLIFHG